MVAIIVPLALFISIAYAIVGVTRSVVDGRTRRRLLESNVTPDLAARIVAAPRAERSSSLEWGLVLGAVGLALIIIQYLPYDEDDPMVMGLLLVAAALGLLANHVISRRTSSADVTSTGALPPSTTAMLAAPVQTEMVRTGQTTTIGG
jgi:hypothetical protein